MKTDIDKELILYKIFFTSSILSQVHPYFDEETSRLCVKISFQILAWLQERDKYDKAFNEILRNEEGSVISIAKSAVNSIVKTILT